jgi:hypothetical protein
MFARAVSANVTAQDSYPIELETRGIGGSLVPVWPREGTYSERSSKLIKLRGK